MKIFLAADHAGFALKNALVEHCRTLGHEVEDMGAFTLNPDDDYPDFITQCAEKVAATPDARGIIIGGSGQGEAMCANRIKGVRAAVFYAIAASTAIVQNPSAGSASAEPNADSARTEDGFDCVRLAREHNDANILSLGARFVSVEEADLAVRIFLETPFSDSPRHARRLAKF